MDVEHLHHLCIYLAPAGAAAPVATSGRREINPTTYHQYSPSDRSSDVYARSGSDLLLVPVSPRSSEAALQEASLQPLPPVPLASEFMLSLSLYLPLSLTHRHTFSLSLSLSLSPIHTPTQARSPSRLGVDGPQGLGAGTHSWSMPLTNKEKNTMEDFEVQEA